jgi:hypothetical protein
MVLRQLVLILIRRAHLSFVGVPKAFTVSTRRGIDVAAPSVVGIAVRAVGAVSSLVAVEFMRVLSFQHEPALVLMSATQIAPNA